MKIQRNDLRMYQFTGRCLSPLAISKDGYDEENIEKVVQIRLRTKIGQCELTEILIVLTNPALARFCFGFACDN